MIINLLSTSISDLAYLSRTSMKVVPMSLRPRSLRITTEFLDSLVTSGSSSSNTGAAAKKRLPYG